MIVRLYWPEYFERNEDGYWLECTHQEAETYILPLLSESLKHKSLKLADTQFRARHAEDEVYCFLVSEDLTNILPFPSYYPYSGQWNAYCPFRKIESKKDNLVVDKLRPLATNGEEIIQSISQNYLHHSEYMTQLQPGNQSTETTRKKTLELMHKGMIVYCLTNMGWDVSDHLGDGYDLLCINKHTKSEIIQVELKSADISSYAPHMKGFSQSISENEIATASHIIVSIFDNILPLGHYIMTVSQLFNKIKDKGTKKYSGYENFAKYKKLATELAYRKAFKKKGEEKETERMTIDFGCGFTAYNNKKWALEDYYDSWENLEKINI